MLKPRRRPLSDASRLKSDGYFQNAATTFALAGSEVVSHHFQPSVGTIVGTCEKSP